MRMLLTFPSPSFPELILFVETRMALPGTERHTKILEGCAKSENPLIPTHPLEWVGIKATGTWNIFFLLPWAPVTSLSRETLRTKPEDFSAVAVTELKRSKHNIFHLLIFFNSISHFCSDCTSLKIFSSFFSVFTKSRRPTFQYWTETLICATWIKQIIRISWS